MGEYILSKKALEDLSAIWDYTFEEWSESQADKYYFMITDCCQEIANHKIAGKKYSIIAGDLFGTRVGQHIIFYKKSLKDRVEEIRIMYGSMDLKIHFEE